MQDIVLERYQNARKSLVDLSLRNRFLNYRIHSRRGLLSESPSPVNIYQTLVEKRAKARLVSKPSDGNGTLEMAQASRDSNALYVQERKEVLDKKLLELWRESRSIQ